MAREAAGDGSGPGRGIGVLHAGELSESLDDALSIVIGVLNIILVLALAGAAVAVLLPRFLAR